MMRAVRVVLLTGMFALLSASPSRAQFAFGPVCPPVYGHPLAVRGFGFPSRGPGFYGAGFAGGFYSRSVFVPPFGPPWNAVPPISTLTPFGWAPGFLPPGWGVGPGWGWFANPPVVVVQPPIVLAGGNAERNVDDGNPALAFEELPKPIDPFPRGARPGQFMVISPRKALPAAGRVVPEVDRVAAVPVPRPPAIRFDPFAKRERVVAEVREADPAKEAVRLVALGRAAFEAGEYGRAVEQFERASAVDPKFAVPHFLKGQSAFAAGRYADAVSCDPHGPRSRPGIAGEHLRPKGALRCERGRLRNPSRRASQSRGRQSWRADARIPPRLSALVRRREARVQEVVRHGREAPRRSGAGGIVQVSRSRPGPGSWLPVTG